MFLVFLVLLHRVWQRAPPRTANEQPIARRPRPLLRNRHEEHRRSGAAERPWNSGALSRFCAVGNSSRLPRTLVCQVRDRAIAMWRLNRMCLQPDQQEQTPPRPSVVDGAGSSSLSRSVVSCSSHRIVLEHRDRLDDRALELPPLANLVFMVRVLCAWFVVLRATTKRASFCVRVCVR